MVIHHGNILEFAKECANEYQQIHENPVEHREKTIRVRWNPPPPPPGWIKLNSDGAVRGNPGLGGAGGVLRDHGGNWMKGLSRNLGFVDSLSVEC